MRKNLKLRLKSKAVKLHEIYLGHTKSITSDTGILTHKIISGRNQFSVHLVDITIQIVAMTGGELAGGS